MRGLALAVLVACGSSSMPRDPHEVVACVKNKGPGIYCEAACADPPPGSGFCIVTPAGDAATSVQCSGVITYGGVMGCCTGAKSEQAADGGLVTVLTFVECYGQ